LLTSQYEINSLLKSIPTLLLSLPSLVTSHKKTIAVKNNLRKSVSFGFKKLGILCVKALRTLRFKLRATLTAVRQVCENFSELCATLNKT
jgi:hypothetical protein